MVNYTYINNFLGFNGNLYRVTDVNPTSETNVLVGIENDIYISIILLVANEVTINDILQTSADMIVETLSA